MISIENLSIISAIGPNRELGNNNKLIWHIKDDLAFYKEMTMNKNIIMGRITLDSMPKNALAGRRPIILTRTPIESNEFIQYFNHLDQLLKTIEQSKEEYMVVGGANIYKQFLPYIDTMYLTHINDSVPHQADCYFPEFNYLDWNIELIKEGNNNNISYQIKKYIRKK